MAGLHPWLEQVFEQALVDYLGSQNHSLETRSSHFNYDSDPSNLNIRPRSESLRVLIITTLHKLPGSSTLFRGVLFDGRYSLPFLSTDERLRTWLWTSNNESKLRAPFSATINCIELRVSNCFEAKVEAFVESFRETDILRHSQIGNLASQPLVSTAPLVAQLLAEYFKESWQEKEPDKMSHFSPTSLKSQASPIRREPEINHISMDSSPISQIRLATQAPMTQAIPRQALKEVAHNMERLTNSKLSEAEARFVRNQQILAAAARHHPQMQQRRTNERKLSATTKSPTAPDAVNEALAPEKERDDSDVDKRQAVQHTTRSQVNLLEDTSGCQASHQGEAMDVCIDVATRDGDTTSNSLAAQNTTADASSKNQSTDHHNLRDDSQTKVRFRRWRVEAAAARYIPRRACKIPTQQLEILEAEESWQPPLPGQASRKGAVPTELLVRLTTAADDEAHRREALTDIVLLEEGPKSPKSRPSGKASYSLNDLPSSQELSESQWPPSPERPDPNEFLPPDSSLPSHDSPLRTIQPGNPTESVGDNDQSMMSSTKDGLDVRERLACRPTELAHVPQLARSSKDSVSTTESVQYEGPAMLQKPELEFRPVAPGIQVHRTPFPGRLDHQSLKRACLRSENAKESLDYPEPSTYVPCTFQESHVQQKNAPKEATKAPQNTSTQAPVNQSADHVQLPQKRKIESEQIETAVKRTKINLCEPRIDREISPDTTRINQEKMTYRSLVLAEMRKPAKQSLPKPLASGSSVVSLQRTASSEQVLGSDSRPTLEGPLHASTPPTVLSSHNGSRSNLHVPKQSGSANALEAQPFASNDVFSVFESTYRDYDGNQKDFDQAIKLLVKLQYLDKAPHPSLFDDFVYHHFHSYRPYIEECLDLDESPAPYSKIFNRIETLVHDAKVLKASVLKQFYNARPSLTETGERRLTRASSICQSQTLEQPMHAEENRDQNSASEAAVFALVVEQGPDTVQDEARDHMHPSQKSSVENWLEHTARAGSPDLGSPDAEPVVTSPKTAKQISAPTPPQKSPPVHQRNHGGDVRAHSLSQVKADVRGIPKEKKPKKKRSSSSPFSNRDIPALNKAATRRSNEKLTAFQRWSDAIFNLPDESIGLSRQVNPFSWRI